MNTKLAVFTYLAVLLSWILPSKIKLLVQGEFSIYTEGWKLRERFMQKLQVEGKKNSKANLSRITPSSSDHGKGYLRPQPAKNYPYDLFHCLPLCIAGLICSRKPFCACRTGVFFYFYFLLCVWFKRWDWISPLKCLKIFPGLVHFYYSSFLLSNFAL